MFSKKTFGFLFFIVLFVFFAKSTVFAENLLLNSSFEEITTGSPALWNKNPSTATLSLSTTSHTGTQSASINKTNSTIGLIYLYQDVDIEIDSFYTLSGYVVKNSSNFSWVILRISWRDSGLKEISKTDSPQLTSDSTSFQLLKIDSVQSPSQAVKARIELAANIATANPANPVLFDDIDFSKVSAPDQPTSVPTNVPTPTNIPTSTPTKTPTPSPTKSPSPTLKATSVLVSPESVKPTYGAGPTSVLGESTESEIRDDQKPSKITPERETKVLGVQTNNLSKILISIGVILLFACGGIVARNYIKSRKDESKEL